MLPSEFVARMRAADERFSDALKRDDIRQMRAALAEKTELLDDYFATPRRCNEEDPAQSHLRDAWGDDLQSSSRHDVTSSRLSGPGSRADAR